MFKVFVFLSLVLSFQSQAQLGHGLGSQNRLSQFRRDAFNGNPFSMDGCIGPEISGQASQLADNFRVSCFNGRSQIAYDLERRFGVVQTLNVEKQVCECLSADERTSDIMSGPSRGRGKMRLNADEYKKEAVSRNVDSLSSLLLAERNGMVIQASLLNSSINREELSASYNLASYDQTSNQKLREINTQLRRNYSEEDVGSVVSGELPDYLFETDTTSCISRRELADFSRIPSEKEFYKDMTENISSYNQSDWDYNTLVKKLIDLRREGNQTVNSSTEINQRAQGVIVARIRFLNNNMLFRNLFASTSNDPEIVQAKHQLFASMKAAYGSEETACKGSGADEYTNCKNEILAVPDKLRELNRESAKIFSNPKIQRETAAVGANIYSDILSSAGKYLNTVLPVPELFQREGSNLLNCNENIRNGDTYTSCLRDFSEYCREIDTNLSNYSENELNELNALLYPDYRGISDDDLAAFCSGKRSKPPGPPVKEEMTFAQYRQEICLPRLDGSTADICGPDAGNKLLSKFLLEYSCVSPDDCNPVTLEDIKRAKQRNLLAEELSGYLDMAAPRCADNLNLTPTQAGSDDIVVVARAKCNTYEGGATRPLSRTSYVSAVRSRVRDFDSSLIDGVSAHSSARRAPASVEAASPSLNSFALATPIDRSISTTPLIIPTTVPVFQVNRTLASLPERDLVRIRDEIQAGSDISQPQLQAGQTTDNLAPLRAQITEGLSNLSSREEKIKALNDRLAELEQNKKDDSSDDESDQRNTGGGSSGRTSGGSTYGSFGGGGQVLPIATPSSAPILGSGGQTFSVPSATRGPSSALGGRSSDGDALKVKYDKANEAQTENGGIIVAQSVEGEGNQAIDPQILSRARDAGAIEITPEAWNSIASGDNPRAGELLVERARSIPGNIVRFTVTTQGNRRMNVVVYKGTGQYLIQPVVPRASLQVLQSVLPQG